MRETCNRSPGVIDDLDFWLLMGTGTFQVFKLFYYWVHFKPLAYFSLATLFPCRSDEYKHDNILLHLFAKLPCKSHSFSCSDSGFVDSKRYRVLDLSGKKVILHNPPSPIHASRAIATRSMMSTRAANDAA